MKAKCTMQTVTKEAPDREPTHDRASVRPDEELLAVYAETGNREAFEELVHRYEPELYHFLRQRLGDTQWAEDAFQATFLQVHLKCRQFAPDRSFRPWLYAIAAHQAVDLVRRNRRHKAVSLSAAEDTDGRGQPLSSLLETNEADPGERLNRIEDRQWTRAALKRVPVKIRQVVILVVYKGLPYQEVANVLGIPLGTVKSRMNAAMSSLHKALVATSRNVATNKRSISPGV
jgi:RNA polymerase sigma-70 factor, ECF subfamily